MESSVRLGLNEIATVLTATWTGNDIDVNAVSIDSRTLTAGGLYIALRGKQLDGHDFIAQAETAGARALIVDHQAKSSLPQLVVNNTALALAQISRLWRQKQQVTVFSVTGSNGKTTVKEMLAAILAVNAPVLATQGNFNNEIGVPLTLLRLSAQHRYAVIEMGANHAREIAFSSRYALADVAIINNVGDAHLEGFGSRSGIASAKGEIIAGLNSTGIAILNQDDAFYSLWLKIAAPRQHLCFSLHQTTADVYGSQMTFAMHADQFVTTFTLHHHTEKIAIQLPLAGQHNVNNAIAAATAAIAINIPLTQIQQGLARVLPVKGRLQPWVGHQGNLIIDDSYNANPTSLKAALDVLEHCSGDTTWLILGAFSELGENSIDIHQQIGKLIRQHGVKRLFALGNHARYSVDAFGEGAVFFDDQDTLIHCLQQTLTGDETLLIKGSRSQAMEQVAAALINDFRT